MKGKFIVLEGIDGSGSSTQAELLQEYFLSIGKKSILSPEPSNGVIGKLIREFLKTKNNQISFSNTDKFDLQMAYLFAADRYYHLYNDEDGVNKLIEDGIHVITTRYYFSSLAYNCKTLQEKEIVMALNQNFPQPDLVIYLDLSINIALERLEKREIKEVYETQQKLTIVRENFLDIFSKYNGLFIKIDGSQSPENIHQEIIKYYESNFRKISI